MATIYINIYKNGDEKHYLSPTPAGYDAKDHEAENGESLEYVRTEVREDGKIIDDDYFY